MPPFSSGSLTEEHSFTASEKDENVRLDKLLTNSFCKKSRNYFQYLIRKQDVLVNGKAIKKRYLLSKGDTVHIRFSLPPQIDLSPENIPLDIVYEDQHLLAINKPSDLVVHPAPGHWSGTVVNAILYHFNLLEELQDPLRPGIVHRLDKDTSGLLLIAKTYEAQKCLIQMFSNREMKKEYLAICIGNPGNTKVEAPIGRHCTQRKKMSVQETGKNATSFFKTFTFNKNLSIVKIILETGRTHQIRVHAKHLNTPILGDSLYGSPQMNKKYQILRQMLHAHKLSFKHPITGDKIDLTAPLPKDMSQFITNFFSLTEKESSLCDF